MADPYALYRIALPHHLSDGDITKHVRSNDRVVACTRSSTAKTYLNKLGPILAAIFREYPQTCPPGYVLSAIAKYPVLESLPAGYALFEMQRSNGKAKDVYLRGHPSGKQFRSAAEFVPHFEWLVKRRISEAQCICKCCGAKAHRDIAYRPKRKRDAANEPLMPTAVVAQTPVGMTTGVRVAKKKRRAALFGGDKMKQDADGEYQVIDGGIVPAANWKRSSAAGNAVKKDEAEFLPVDKFGEVASGDVGPMHPDWEWTTSEYVQDAGGDEQPATSPASPSFSDDDDDEDDTSSSDSSSDSPLPPRVMRVPQRPMTMEETLEAVESVAKLKNEHPTAAVPPPPPLFLRHPRMNEINAYVEPFKTREEGLRSALALPGMQGATIRNPPEWTAGLVDASGRVEHPSSIVPESRASSSGSPPASQAQAPAQVPASRRESPSPPLVATSCGSLN
ncbi:hypothetical protein BDK51DRAFT_26284 [Blyttiomyces helicus]|uniref:Cryptic loci regulator 2 N-terminal domain-containing protein n=1 Tax=Blyttiomyces helicus TaxID=388810 RepID=A0A4P9WKY3_9FUNG|nr:hypothetical protein BDK51DRAFT_26284 [Blyttiomyces helicus]|eukprot:RKO93671.1 hypothetical protein BDK51DRAFT_26284 [Blyttiomyces helicus]